MITMLNEKAYPYAQERYEAFKKRNEKSFCTNHPMILPENEEQIRWEMGMTKKADGTIIKYKHCPKCHMSKVIE